MPDEEAFEIVKETRFLRRQLPEKKTRAKAVKKPKLTTKQRVAALTPAQKEELLKSLEGQL
jgi:hypothetical protein